MTSRSPNKAPETQTNRINPLAIRHGYLNFLIGSLEFFHINEGIQSNSNLYSSSFKQ